MVLELPARKFARTDGRLLCVKAKDKRTKLCCKAKSVSGLEIRFSWSQLAMDNGGVDGTEDFDDFGTSWEAVRCGAAFAGFAET